MLDFYLFEKIKIWTKTIHMTSHISLKIENESTTVNYNYDAEMEDEIIAPTVQPHAAVRRSLPPVAALDFFTFSRFTLIAETLAAYCNTQVLQQIKNNPENWSLRNVKIFARATNTAQQMRANLAAPPADMLSTQFVNDSMKCQGDFLSAGAHDMYYYFPRVTRVIITDCLTYCAQAFDNANRYASSKRPENLRGYLENVNALYTLLDKYDFLVLPSTVNGSEIETLLNLDNFVYVTTTAIGLVEKYAAETDGLTVPENLEKKLRMVRPTLTVIARALKTLQKTAQEAAGPGNFQARLRKNSLLLPVKNLVRSIALFPREFFADSALAIPLLTALTEALQHAYNFDEAKFVRSVLKIRELRELRELRPL